MKKINILEHLYECEDAAHELLGQYLGQIHMKFAEEPDLIRDIELGIIEHLDLLLLPRTCKQLNKNDIISLIQKMGDIEMLDDHINNATLNFGSQKLLYRDDENRIIAGVCAGIAAYFNVSNWLVRFIVITFLFTPIPVIIPYFLMWFFLPRAITKAEKLHMRGIPVNINTLANYNLFTRNRIMHVAKVMLIILATIVIIVCSIAMAIFIF